MSASPYSPVAKLHRPRERLTLGGRMAWAALLAATGLAAGCAVGPRYHRPAPPGVSAYTAGPPPARTARSAGPAGQAQRFSYGAAVPADWWSLFRSPPIESLMRTALADNPTLAAAKARLRAAQAEIAVQTGSLYPQINGAASAARERAGRAFPGAPSPGVFNLYTGTLNVTYYPDFFGINRLLVRGAVAQADVSRYELHAAYLALAGNVASTALRIAALQDEIDATTKIIREQQRLLALTTVRYRAGAEPYLSVADQTSLVASAEATLPPLQTQRAQLNHALSVYLGKAPAEFHAPRLRLNAISLPVNLPVTLPSALVEQRPDIGAAEAQLRAANAAVGVARAQRFPLLTLTGSLGRQSLESHDFFDSQNAIWSGVAGLTAPIFHGGTLRAQERVAAAQYQAFVADYRQTVLGALAQVADALRALDGDATALKAQQRASHAAREAFKLAQASYREGAVDYLVLLTSEVQYEQATIQEVRARDQRYLDTVALFVALGGGWWDDQGAAPVLQPVSATTPGRSPSPGGHP